MVGYIEESKGGDFKPTPEGQHEMVCTRVVDLGTHQSEFNGEKKTARKILITWEIPGVRTQIDGKDLPAHHSERFTWSFHEKATLRQRLENWRGTPFKPEDFAGPPNGFHIKKLLGVPCYAQIMHETGANGRTYANLTSIMRYPGKPDAWPKAEGELIFFDLDDFSQDTFDKLPKRIRAMIAETPEGAYLIQAGAMRYQPDDQAQGGGHQNGHGQQSARQSSYDAQRPSGAPAGGADYGDEVPFAPCVLL